ncbi:DoxX family protein [Streptomyces sp. NBC_00388]|uniref:DoxX family protein n=1 Tax=Streptomyces sp. NBC_00388 TaxID=2975735 RepID=UPI002E1DAF19
MPAADRPTKSLVALLAGAGATHFLVPGWFDATVPPWLPGRARTYTQVSGVIELLLAAGVAVPATRRASARAAAGLFVAVFPANLQMAYDWRHRPAPLRAAALARLPLQLPLIAWAEKVSRTAPGAAGR